LRKGDNWNADPSGLSAAVVSVIAEDWRLAKFCDLVAEKSPNSSE
jgi:hypothetical protein